MWRQLSQWMSTAKVAFEMLDTRLLRGSAWNARARIRENAIVSQAASCRRGPQHLVVTGRPSPYFLDAIAALRRTFSRHCRTFGRSLPSVAKAPEPTSPLTIMFAARVVHCLSAGFPEECAHHRAYTAVSELISGSAALLPTSRDGVLAHSFTRSTEGSRTSSARGPCLDRIRVQGRCVPRPRCRCASVSPPASSSSVICSVKARPGQAVLVNSYLAGRFWRLPNRPVSSHTTRAACLRPFEYRDLGILPVTGIDYPVHVWRSGREPVGSRFEALRAASTPLMVSRKRSFVDASRGAAKVGDGSVVLIVGEPGGKSRIAQTC